MENETRIQWKRIIVEGSAIVFSILLAFAIDAWWDERQEESDERALLIALKTEFETNLSKIDAELSYRRAVDTSIMRILEAGAGHVEIEPDEMDKLLSDLVWWGSAEFQTGALVSTIEGGYLSLVENEGLRHLLAGLPAEYGHMRKLEDQDKETLRNHLNPYIFRNISLPQISNSLAGRPGTGENLSTTKYPVATVKDHRLVLGDNEFVSIVTQSRYDHIDAIWRYGILKERITQVIELIEGELE